MPLSVEISLINTIEGKSLTFQDLSDSRVLNWNSPPPETLSPYQYSRCNCTGPSSGYEIGLKYDGMVCRIDVTAWGVKFRKSTPTQNDMELIQVKEKAPYRLELILI